MYKLYTFSLSSTAWRARIALNLKKVQAEHISVNLITAANRTDQYRKINPITGVPTLVLPDGTKLIESMAIIEYLNQVYPEPNNLFPGCAANRALIRGYCEVINSGIHPYQNLKLLEKVEKDFGMKRADWAIFWITHGLKAVESLTEEHSKGGKFVFGDVLTAADVFLYPQIFNSKTRYNLDMSVYPNINRVFSNLQKVKEIQDAAPEKQKDYVPFPFPKPR